MTADELVSYFNRVFGLKTRWPKTFEVDAITYANCCQAIFNHIAKNGEAEILSNDWILYRITLGKQTNGLMFKNVELILKGD